MENEFYNYVMNQRELESKINFDNVDDLIDRMCYVCIIFFVNNDLNF